MNQSVEKARVAIDLGRYDKAEELLGTALAAEPDHAEAAAYLAGIGYTRGDYARAVELCERALRVDPHYQYPWRIMAMARAQQGELTDEPEERAEHRRRAVAAARRCVELDADCAENHRILAVVTTPTDPRAAHGMVERALDLEPENADLHVLSASILRRCLRDDNAAEVALRRALALDPENADAVQEMAYLDLAVGRRVIARRRLQRLAALDHTRSPLVRSLLQAMRDEPVRPMPAVRRKPEKTGPRHTWGWAAAVVGLIFVCRLLASAFGSEPEEPRSRMPSMTTYRMPLDHYVPPTFPSRPAMPSLPPIPTYSWPRAVPPR